MEIASHRNGTQTSRTDAINRVLPAPQGEALLRVAWQNQGRTSVLFEVVAMEKRGDRYDY